MGLSQSVLEEPPDDQPFRVFACNWETVQIWRDVWPRWRVVVTAFDAVRQALDLNQVTAALTLRGIRRKAWAGIFEGLKVMEDTTLTELSGENGEE